MCKTMKIPEGDLALAYLRGWIPKDDYFGLIGMLASARDKSDMARAKKRTMALLRQVRIRRFLLRVRDRFIATWKRIRRSCWRGFAV